MIVDLDKPITKKLKNIKVSGKAVSVRRLDLVGTAYLADTGKDAKSEASAEDIARVVINGLIFTQTGERVYSDDQVKEVAKKDGATLMAIFNAICSLYEEEEKN